MQLIEFVAQVLYFNRILKRENHVLLGISSIYFFSSHPCFNCIPTASPSPGATKLASRVPSAFRDEITSPSALPESGHAKPMGALLSKPLPQLLTLINLMCRSVEGTVWKSSQSRDPVPCRWTERKLGKLWRVNENWVQQGEGEKRGEQTGWHDDGMLRKMS